MPGRVQQDQGSCDPTTNRTNTIRKASVAMSTAAKCPSPPAMGSRVKFIPAQMDAHAGSTTTARRESPVFGLWRDMGVARDMIPYMPLIVYPFRTTDKSAELYPWSLLNIRDAVLQTLLAIIQAVMILGAPVALFCTTFFFPGGLLLALIAACWTLIYIIALPMQGPRIVYENPKMASDTHPDERWLFINGCLTGHVGLQQNVNRLSKTFGRPVTGIHNQSYGLFYDLLECLVQRCWSYNTEDTRIAYQYVKANLIEPSVSKVVLIGHSQGGIIVSMVVDRLLADLPIETVSKLEVYTFGSAASHFNNPRLTLKPKSSPQGNEVNFSNPRSDNVIPHVEHYCNERDMVTRWGVIYSVEKILERRYSGKVFVLQGASGHMFNQHYMDPIFPLHRPESRTGGLLNEVVHVDESLAKMREEKAVECLKRARTDSGLSPVAFGNGETVPLKLIVEGESQADPYLSLVATSTPGAVAARGKTLGELSRLWRYIDGKSPSASAGETNGSNDATASGA